MEDLYSAEQSKQVAAMSSMCSEATSWEGRAAYGSEDDTSGIDTEAPFQGKPAVNNRQALTQPPVSLAISRETYVWALDGHIAEVISFLRFANGAKIQATPEEHGSDLL